MSHEKPEGNNDKLNAEWGAAYNQFHKEKKKLIESKDKLNFLLMAMTLTDEQRKKLNVKFDEMFAELNTIMSEVANVDLSLDADLKKQKILEMPAIVEKINDYTSVMQGEYDQLQALVADQMAANREQLMESENNKGNILQIKQDLSEHGNQLLHLINATQKELKKNFEHEIKPEFDTYNGLFGWFWKIVDKKGYDKYKDQYQEYINTNKTLEKVSIIITHADAYGNAAKRVQ
jgi:hypothetical protein